MRNAHPDVRDRQLTDIQATIEEGILQGQRIIPGPLRIAPRIRRPVIRWAARAASLHWRLAVSERMAERCLEAYRTIKSRGDAAIAEYVPRADKPEED